MKIKTIILNLLIVVCLLFVSCSDVSNNNSDVSNNNINENSSSQNEEEPSITFYTRVLKRDLNRTTWYLSTISNHYSYYSFYDGKISHKTGQYGNSVVGYAEGKYSFLEGSQTKIKIKWDKVAGDPGYDEIIIIDNDILILAYGLEGTNNRIWYKDIDAYTQNNPFMGLGKFDEHNGDEWIVFTPSGNCYKRYTDFIKEELVIVCGHWEKNSDDGFKIYWDGNAKDYDILVDTKLYQNINKNASVIPISLSISK